MSLVALKTVVLVFVPFAGGYFLSYLFRSVNAVIAPQLIGEVGLNADDLGLLTAAYFLAFASFQLPLGVLLDRFGPRRVQAALLLFAALGALVFAFGQTRLELIVGRALIGLGFAGGLMASFKAVTLWIARERWPLANGLMLATGGLGAVAATKPVELLLGLTDWRTLFLGLAGITTAVAALIYLVVPREPGRRADLTLATQLGALRVIYSDRYFWRLAPVSVTTLATGMAIQGLWAGPWFRDVARLGRAGVADHLLALTIGVLAGMVGSGVLADALRRVGWSLLEVLRACVVAYLLVQLLVVYRLDPTQLWSWVAFGFFSNMAVLAFPCLSAHVPLEHAGSAATGLNVLIFGGAFGVQYGVGIVINLWDPAARGGFQPDAYGAAFSLLIVLQAAAFLWFLRRGDGPAL
jgi:MFS family permease